MSAPIDPFLQRCIQLARLGGTRVCPNPLVGSVVVQGERIIGEGYHQALGEAHAEVNAIRSVKEQALLTRSTLYVSLEPCSHYGKTPPCADLIIAKKIPKVVIGCPDPNPKVNGKGINRLRKAGVEVILADDPAPFVELNRYFFVNQRLNRPFITLKWAESADRFIAAVDQQGNPLRTPISCPESSYFTHKVRATHHAIMVGRRTAEIDDPSLTTRHYPGEHPIRLILDRTLQLPPDLKVFNDGGQTVVINEKKEAREGSVRFFQVVGEEWQPASLLTLLYKKLGIASIMVEGGARTHKILLENQLWDEILLTRGQNYLYDGLPAPPVKGLNLNCIDTIGQDRIFRALPASRQL